MAVKAHHSSVIEYRIWDRGSNRSTLQIGGVQFGNVCKQFEIFDEKD